MGTFSPAEMILVKLTCVLIGGIGFLSVLYLGIGVFLDWYFRR